MGNGYAKKKLIEWYCYYYYYYNNKTEAFLVASKAFGLDVNAEKNKYIFLSREQNAVESHNIKILTNFWKDGTIQAFGNRPNQSRLH